MKTKIIFLLSIAIILLMTISSCDCNPRHYIVEADGTYPIYFGLYELRDERWNKTISRSFIVYGNSTEKIKTYGLPLIEIHAWDYTGYIKGSEADSHITLIDSTTF